MASKPLLPKRVPGQNGTNVGGEKQPVPQAQPKTVAKPKGK
jgi:hypothetical protein